MDSFKLYQAIAGIEAVIGIVERYEIVHCDEASGSARQILCHSLRMLQIILKNTNSWGRDV